MSPPHSSEPSLSSLSPSEKEHLIKGELIHHLSPYYDFHPHSLFQTLRHRLLHSHAHSHIEIEDFPTPPLEGFSAQQRLRRSVFALKKIKEFNHHFFNDQEQRILNPLAPGLISYAVQYSGIGVTGLFGYWMIRTWSMNVKTFAVLGGLLAMDAALMRAPNSFNEMIQNLRRKNLARKYIDVYGEQFLNELINPKYDLGKIRTMENLVRRLD